MEKDPIVEEIRKNREEIYQECGQDAGEYFKHLLEEQKKYKEKLVSFGPEVRAKKAVNE